MDPSKEFLGQRLNFYVALVLLIGAAIAFVWSQRRDGGEPVDPAQPGLPRRAGGSRARPAKRG